MIPGYLFFVLHLFESPGTITNEASFFDLTKCIYDQNFQKRYCITCCVMRPARAKHCSHCGYCVMRMDHHCVWINNCVGINNHLKFYFFILSGTVTELLFILIQYLYLSPKFGEYQKSTEESIIGQLFVRIMTICQTETLSVMILVPHFALLVLLAGLWLQQTVGILKNLTTNEQINAIKYTDYISVRDGRAKNLVFDLGYKQNFYDFLNSFTIELQNPFLWNGIVRTEGSVVRSEKVTTV